MIAVMGMNSRDGKKLFKLKDNVDNRLNGYKLSVNIFRLEIRKFLIKEVQSGNCLPTEEEVVNKLTHSKTELNNFINRIAQCDSLICHRVDSMAQEISSTPMCYLSNSLFLK